MVTMSDDDDIPRGIEIPKPIAGGPPRPDFSFLAAVVARAQAKRVCETCGGPLGRQPRFCSNQCFRLKEDPASS